MTKATRMERLRELLRRTELLPASPERDRLVVEFRSRLVDLDTGVKPRGMLPMAEPDPAPVPRAPQRRSPPRLPQMAPAEPAPPLEAPSWPTGRLSLEEALGLAPLPGERAVPSWTLGLRGSRDL